MGPAPGRGGVGPPLAILVRPATGPGEDAALRAAAWAVIDLASGAVLAGNRTALLDVPVLPGSLMKVAALLAAADAGLLDGDTRLACPRRVRVAGRTLDCAHPVLAAPPDAAHALAHSCNGFFAAVLHRLSLDGLSRAARRLHLPALDPGTDVVLAGLGLAGPRVPVRVWTGALARIANLAERPGEAGARLAVEGLRLAVSEGTARAFAVEPRGWLAKTGTAPMPGGGIEGLLVAIEPGLDRAVVVMAPGAAGRDAAAIGALAWRSQAAFVGDRSQRGVSDDLVAGFEASSARAGAVIRVGRARRGGYETETLPLETYVAAIVAGEAATAPEALQEALAIVARSYAVAARGRHAADGFDVCDLTHCQVVGQPTAASHRAVRRTAGRVLLQGGRPLRALYSAQCGGWLEAAGAVWPGSAPQVPPAPARRDPAAVAEPTWIAELPAGAIEHALRAAGFRGARLESLDVISRTPSGRVARMGLSGFAPAITSGEGFRLAIGRALGWQHVKSTHFTVTRTAAGYRFDGRGRGHGVGMCLLGAASLARDGATPGDILRAYFPEATVGELSYGLERPTEPDVAQRRAAAPMPDVSIALPLETESVRQRIEAMVRRAADEIVRRSGARMPEVIRVHVHPTPESFRRATGLPWGATGAVREGTIVLPPLRGLEGRGRLERTLRHEVAHLITAPALARRPRWVLEGAAIHFGGFPHSPAAPRSAAPCPSDESFARATSVSQLAQLYADAHTCVVRALDRGLDWRNIE